MSKPAHTRHCARRGGAATRFLVARRLTTLFALDSRLFKLIGHPIGGLYTNIGLEQA